jgi:sortase A
MRLLRILGKLLISVGAGVLLFVAWTLWGTGLYYSEQQDSLREEFARLPARAASSNRPGTPPPGFNPRPGQPVFLLKIPAIDVDQVVVEGVGTKDLRKGPGHYPSCRGEFTKPLCTEFPETWPGERGRVIVSGHRTTYGAPFWDLNKLKAEDRIHIETKWGDFTYEVTKKDLVLPDSPAVVIQELDKRELALTTCNPRFSAAQRLIVYATLASFS